MAEDGNMKDYKQQIQDCIDALNAVRFPCADWKEDKVYFDRLEKEFADEPTDADTKVLWTALHKLIEDKRTSSLNMNKTTEELYAGWED